MAEGDSERKKKIYAEIRSTCTAFWESYPDMTFVGRMSSMASVLKNAFKDDYWFCGFYTMKNAEWLEIGPYQSSILATADIKLGKGVCGTAAETKETQIVEDVKKCQNYIACDAETKSEIVVPVFNKAGDLVAVLDIDSEKLAAFDEVDKVRQFGYVD